MKRHSFQAEVDLASLAGRRAVTALWWIYHEVGNERVLEIERESFATTADLGERTRLLFSRMMEWARVEVDEIGRELLGLLQAGFQESPLAEELEQQKQRILEACRTFVQDTHPEESEDRLLESAEALYLIALTVIPLRELPLAAIAFGILQKRRERRPPDRNWSRFTTSLDRLRFESDEREEIAKVVDKARRRQAQPDLVEELLACFFEAKDGYWREFFDSRSRMRLKKLPLFPRMLRELVRLFRSPSNFRIDTEIAACELSARCAKAAFPKFFPKLFYDGESVRKDLQYHEQMSRRAPNERPRSRRH
jgi:hypothetical protein